MRWPVAGEAEVAAAGVAVEVCAEEAAGACEPVGEAVVTGAVEVVAAIGAVEVVLAAPLRCLAPRHAHHR